MGTPVPGIPLGSDEFEAELRWALAQVAFLHPPEEHSENRLEEVRERVSLLCDRGQCVLLTDREARAQLVGELDRAAEALHSVSDLHGISARHRIREAEDRLSSALGTLGQASAGEQADRVGREPRN